MSSDEREEFLRRLKERIERDRLIREAQGKPPTPPLSPEDVLRQAKGVRPEDSPLSGVRRLAGRFRRALRAIQESLSRPPRPNAPRIRGEQPKRKFHLRPRWGRKVW